VALGDVDLNLLVALDALLTERNVTRAGQRIGLSQPTTSRALARLRRMLHDPLLVKVGREMQLTPRAERLAPQVREILQLADRAIHESLDFDPPTSTAGFSVSCSDYVTLVLMGRVIARLREVAPRVELHLLPRRSDNHGMLRRGEVDLVIEPRALMKADGLSSWSIFTDRWRCAVWSGSELARGRLDVGRFASAPYLTYTLGTDRIANLADQLIEREGLGREPTVTTENFSLVPFLLRGTDMVSLVLERGILAFGDGVDITLRDAPVNLPELVETMYWNPRHDDDPAQQWLRDTIADVAGRL
jgi:DNA-binding transcriptional LysR family regulator